MRHPCMLAALLIASGSCFAQSSVGLYGIVDLGMRSLDGLNAGNAPVPGGRTNSISSGVNGTSRWGFRAQESLGGGWKALFRVEGGINADTGAPAKSDRLFDRQAWVGLESPYGTVLLGRQPNLISDALIAVDPIGKRFASFNPNINVAGLSNTKFGTHSFGTQYGPSGYADNFYRLDNTLKYTATVGPWQARAAYAFGEVAGDASAGSSHGAALAYQRPEWAVSGAAMQFRSQDGLPLDAWSLGAMVRQGAWQFKANFARNTADTGADRTVHQRVTSAGASRTLGHDWLVTAAWYGVRREATGQRDDGFDREFLFVEKALAPSTTAYLEADYTTWHGDAAGLTGGLANERHGAGLTLGLMQKF
ncbi:putative porin [Pseudoduganella lurida]|uniref:Putative porin n=1 Tax=Pseudoduganella lurida TaxID=1036180 RepID=A0A562REJ9_9BURK|nr:porin [Pseudoduganella lurida]TWI67448.1 putative porin [Pseudoduganella lurida]